ncbi:co-chaperonin GroES [Levilactobacillus zymae DSM 19395]|nr:co-chaperonin GroES [Levilactobacillus zymae DSM 19395]
MLKLKLISKFIGGIQVLKPLGDRVILDQPQEQEETVGGIVLASNAQEKPQTANVVAVGDGRVLDNGEKVAPSVKVGDKVLFDKYSGTEVKYQDKTYLVLHEKDLVAVID